jgi:hypothetical protein
MMPLVIILNVLSPHLTNAQDGGIQEKENSLIFQGPYLGQSPTGRKPEPFAPDLLPPNLNWHGSPTFTTDGTEFYFSSFDNYQRMSERIYCMKMVDGVWTGPEYASFSGEYFEGAPFISPDGQYLFYSSARPLEAGREPKPDRDIWFVRRTDRGWSAPIRAGFNTEKLENHPFLSELGNLYYQCGSDIYRVRMLPDDEFSKPERLGDRINTEQYGELSPCIDPRERFMIFYSSRPGGFSKESAELYVVFQTPDGDWTEPRNLGPEINGDTVLARFPMLSPDLKYLFFTRADKPFGDKLYWVDIRFLDQLKR